MIKGIKVTNHSIYFIVLALDLSMLELYVHRHKKAVLSSLYVALQSCMHLSKQRQLILWHWSVIWDGRSGLYVSNCMVSWRGWWKKEQTFLICHWEVGRWHLFSHCLTAAGGGLVEDNRIQSHHVVLVWSNIGAIFLFLMYACYQASHKYIYSKIITLYNKHLIFTQMMW